MTAHQLARQLLDGPDLPIGLPPCTYNLDDEYAELHEPAVSREGGKYVDRETDVLVISYATPRPE